jgi:hypothetical protein
MVSSASLETHHSPTHEFLSNFTLEKKNDIPVVDMY